MIREALSWASFVAEGLSVGLGAIAGAPTREDYERESEARRDAQAALAGLREERDALLREAQARLSEVIEVEHKAEQAHEDLREALGSYCAEEVNDPIAVVRLVVSMNKSLTESNATMRKELQAARRENERQTELLDGYYANMRELERQLRAAKDDADHQRMLALSYQDADHAARATVRQMEAEVARMSERGLRLLREHGIHVTAVVSPERERVNAELAAAIKECIQGDGQ
jgi:hypothetical protein